MPDDYTYPGTEVLVNIPGYTDPAAWKQAETAVVSLRMRELICETGCMEPAVLLDLEAIRRACERYGVERLRVFGSVLTDRFNPEASDVDFLVAFQPGRENLFHDYFDLKGELERVVGRGVDLVMERSVKNPFFKASAFGSAQDIYAA